MLPSFELLTPTTLSEALQMMSEGPTPIVPIAGGTNVVVSLRERRPAGQVLMDVSRLEELRGIWREDGHIIFGGGTTISELLADPLIQQYGAPLAAAAAVLGSPLVRNRATVAGNLVDASPAADMAPPLLVLDAQVELTSRSISRRIPLERFMVAPNETLRQPEELLTTIRWSAPGERSAAAFRKIGLRNALACSVITVAVRLETDARGRCQKARIAMGAVAPRPMRAHEAESALQGETLTHERIERAAQLAAAATSPIDDVRASAAYRRRMAEVLVRRLLSEVAQELGAN